MRPDEQDKRAVEVTEDAYWRYNGEVDRAERLMTYAWTPGPTTTTKTSSAGPPRNGPLHTRLIWKRLRDPANRQLSAGQPGIDESLVDQYRAIDPHFGADLVISP